MLDTGLLVTPTFPTIVKCGVGDRSVGSLSEGHSGETYNNTYVNTWRVSCNITRWVPSYFNIGMEFE